MTSETSTPATYETTPCNIGSQGSEDGPLPSGLRDGPMIGPFGRPASLASRSARQEVGAVNIEKLEAVEREIERFGLLARWARHRLAVNDRALARGSRTGATRHRASMDLTRALAELRKP